MVNVEIWSDILCPFCFLGKKRFEAALAQFPNASEVKVVWRSFELDPAAEAGQEAKIHDLLAKKYGRTAEWARQMNNNLAVQAADLGLKFDFESLIPSNSFDAHRVLHFAATKNKYDEVQDALFSAYFCEGKDVADHETLIDLAGRAGLDENETREILDSDRFSAEVRRDESRAERLRITGVPAFVLNQQFLVSGAQPAEVFLDALETAWSNAEEQDDE